MQHSALNPLFHPLMKPCRHQQSVPKPPSASPCQAHRAGLLGPPDVPPLLLLGLPAFLFPGVLRRTRGWLAGRLPFLTSVLRAEACPRGSASGTLGSDVVLFSLRTVSIFLYNFFFGPQVTQKWLLGFQTFGGFPLLPTSTLILAW